MAKRLKFHNQSVMAADFCTVGYAGLPLCVCTVCTLHEVSSSFLSLSLSHSQLVLSRGIHPSLLTPFFVLSQLLSLPLSLSAPSFCTPPSSSSPSFSFSYLNLLSSVISLLFMCPGEALRTNRVCVHIEDGSVLRCRQQNQSSRQQDQSLHPDRAFCCAEGWRLSPLFWTSIPEALLIYL